MVVLFWAECHRMVRLWWSYRLNTLSSLAATVVVFPIPVLILQNLVVQNGAEYGVTGRTLSLLGFLTWHLCMTLLAAVPEMIQEEVEVGTLENVMMAPFALHVTLSMRMLVLCLRYAVETAILALILSLLLRVPLEFSPLAFLVALMTLIGTCGVGMGIAGLALVHKAIRSVTSVISILALLLSGALAPINSLGIFFDVLKYLFPTTWGIDVLRSVVVQQLSSATLRGDLVGLGLQTVFFLGGGIWIFLCTLEKAKVQGDLAAY